MKSFMVHGLVWLMALGFVVERFIEVFNRCIEINLFKLF